MLTTYTITDGKLTLLDISHKENTISRAVWIDLLEPAAGEVALVQNAFGIEVPSREEMQEIESSSRLYREDEALFMTAPFLFGVDAGLVGSTSITFVLTSTTLITVRYATPKAFGMFSARAAKTPALLSSPDGVMLGLFEQIVDRLADVLEHTAASMDTALLKVFHTQHPGREPSKHTDKRDAALRHALDTLGHVGNVTSRASESLLGLSRILSFVSAEQTKLVCAESRIRIKTLVRDVRSLMEHTSMLTNKANFVLDATLGLINIEQTAIMKVFTVATVALMPPTLIAGIYGMNFGDGMPELRWVFGYPYALLLMLLSAIAPVLYFKRKGWL